MVTALVQLGQNLHPAFFSFLWNMFFCCSVTSPQERWSFTNGVDPLGNTQSRKHLLPHLTLQKTSKPVPSQQCRCYGIFCDSFSAREVLLPQWYLGTITNMARTVVAMQSWALSKELCCVRRCLEKLWATQHSHREGHRPQGPRQHLKHHSWQGCLPNVFC